MKLGKVIRELDVEFDEELIPPLEDVPSQPAPSSAPQMPLPAPV
jgi:hypothetical protein